MPLSDEADVNIFITIWIIKLNRIVLEQLQFIIHQINISSYRMRSSLTARSRGSRLQKSQDEFSGTLKMSNTNNSAFNYFQQQSEIKKYKAMVSDLQLMLQSQKEKNGELKQKMQLLARRTIIRERQFHNILQKTNKTINNYKRQPQPPLLLHLESSQAVSRQCEQHNIQFQQSHLKIEKSNKEQISNTYTKILDNFECSTKATNDYIQKRYTQSMKSMENRISTVMQIFDQQVEKMKKVTNINKATLQKQIHEILNIAKNIEQENVFLRSKYTHQINKSKLLQEEKQLLIEQIINKKKFIVRLYSENKKYKQKYENNELQISPLSLESLNKNQQKKEHGINQNENDQQVQILKKKLLTGRQLKTNEFITQCAQNFSRGKHQHNKTFVSKSISKSSNIQQKREDVKESRRYPNKKSQAQQRIIDHLKNSLEREKKKNVQLNRLLVKIQSQNEQINQTLIEIINEIKISKNKSKGSNLVKEEFQKLKFLMKSEKLFQTIKHLKKRLSMVEKPSVGCGWGEEGLDPLLQI